MGVTSRLQNVDPNAKPRGNRFSDITGRPFGQLCVVRLYGFSTTRDGMSYWACVCGCGKEVVVSKGNLVRGHTTSCGCVAAAKTSARNRCHGMRHAKEYSIWSGMWNRCTNAHCPDYRRYGGRGITVCERWKSFPDFYQDMGARPTMSHSLERKDNDGPYSPENCVWATATTQARNKSTTSFVTAFGRRLPLATFCELFNQPLERVRERLKAGWPPDLALTLPPRKTHCTKQEHRLRRQARMAVSIKVRAGRLQRKEACEECGRRRRTQAHHHQGYEREHRLTVRWLCGRCHVFAEQGIG